MREQASSNLRLGGGGWIAALAPASGTLRAALQATPCLPALGVGACGEALMPSGIRADTDAVLSIDNQRDSDNKLPRTSGQ